MEIALKNNSFDNQDIFLDLTDTNREEIARICTETAVKADFISTKIGISTYDAYTQIVKYLAIPEHRKSIVVYKQGSKDIYFLYKPRSSARTIPQLVIENVDVTRPWIITDRYGFEEIVYLKTGQNNQMLWRF